MICFIKALHKGHYSYDAGQPGGLNIMSTPHTLNGSGQENFNINQLLAAESNKDDLSSNEKKILNSSTISPPRTINYAIKMLSAYTSVLKLGGEKASSSNRQKISQNGQRKMNTYSATTLHTSTNHYQQN